MSMTAVEESLSVNDESRMPKDEGMTNDQMTEIVALLLCHSGFVLPSSFVIRISSFRDDGLSAMQFFQLAPNLALAFGQFLWHVDLNNDVEITALPGDARHSAFPQAKSLVTLCARRNFQAHISFESWHHQFAAQHGAPRLDLHLMNQVTTFDRKIGMSRQTHAKKKVTAFSAAHAGFALAAQADTLPFVNTARNLYLIIFHLV